MSKDEKKYDVVVIGGGAAGMTAALYAARAGVDVLIVEENYALGGQLLLTSEITNYMGFEHVSGMDLAEDMRKQLPSSVGIIYGSKATVESKQGKTFTITLSGSENKVVKTKSVVLAAGTKHKKLSSIGYSEAEKNTMVSYCALCDGTFFENERVAVIGGGDSALEEAIYLSEMCMEVVLIHRGESLTAKDYLIKRAQGIPNISMVFNREVAKIDILSANKLELIFHEATESTIVNGLFVAIGAAPPPDILSDKIQKKIITTVNGYHHINAETGESPYISGLFIAGDITHKKYRQIATAVADGVISGISAAEYAKSFK